MSIHRNVAFGQWRGCKFFIHVGSICVTFGELPGDGYAAGIEIMTPMRRFSIRRSQKR